MQNHGNIDAHMSHRALCFTCIVALSLEYNFDLLMVIILECVDRKWLAMSGLRCKQLWPQM